MANVVKHKRSSTPGETPAAADLEVGEIAVNTADAKLFVKHTDGNVVEISGSGGGGGASLVWTSGGATTGTIDYWAKVATFAITGDYNDGSFIYAFFSEESGTPSTAIIQVSVRQNGTGQDNGVDVELISAPNAAPFSDDSFKLLDDGSQTDIELWVKKNANYHTMKAFEIGKNTESVEVTYHQNSTWQSTEPTGTGNNVKSDGIKHQGNKIWHAGNDGANSGLDADLLDGQHGSYYLNLANATGEIAEATSSAHGGLRIGYSENGKNYPVELNNDGQAFVNVPWVDTDTNTTYSTATSSTLGLVKIGYTESGKNYPVELDNGQMYVNVPWTDTDTNTTYSTATSSALGLVKIGYTESGKNYPVELDNGQMYVNVPWTDNNTTYSTATSSTAGLVKIGYTESGKNYPVELDNGQMYVNVPWTDTDTNTTYSAGTAIDLSGTTFSLSSTISGKRDFTGGVVISNPSSVGHIQMGNIGNDQQNAYIRGAFLVQRNEDQITYDSSTDTWTHAGGSSTDWSMWAHTASGMRFYTGASVSSSTDYTPAQFDNAYLSVSIGTDGQWDWKKAAQFSGNVTISGNLTVSGSTTTVNSGTINLADSVLTLNSDLLSTVDPTENAGFEVNRGTGSTVGFIWNEANDEWTAAASDGTYYKIWHAGNDGSGSTLDADKLDGVHGSSFLRSDANDTYTGLLSFGNTSSRIDGSDGFPLVQVNSSRAYFGSTSRSKTVLASNSNTGAKSVVSGTEYSIFHDNYHPNADKWTTARSHTVTLTGDVTGTATQSVDGSGNKTWSISTTVGNDSHTHNKLIAVDDRDMKPNTSGIQSGTQAIRAFFSSKGGMTGTSDGNYHDVLVLDTYSDSSGGGPNAITFDKGNSAGNPEAYLWKGAWGGTTWGTGQRIFADNYHPNADKWTTARTHTVNLTGDVTGSASQSVDGTGNRTWNIATTLQNQDEYAPRKAWTSTLTKDSYTRIARVTGNDLATITRFSFAGTTGSVVVGAIADIIVNHSADIHIQTQSGDYTQLTLKVHSNGSNEDYDLYAKYTTGSGTSLSLRVEAYSLNDETITANPTATAYSGGTELEHAMLRGTKSSQSSSNADIWTDGNVTAANMLINQYLYHSGDLDTYMEFQGANQWRVVTGGSQKLKIDGSIHLDAHLYAGNFNIYEVNALQFNDPGPNEGLEWVGGNGWKIYESPDDLTTNSGGNLQFVTGSTRRMTLQTDGDLNLLGENVWFDGTNTYLRSDNDFKFLTDGGSAQRGRFKSLQVSTSYSGTPPDNGILFGTDVNLYRNAANELKTDDQMEAAAFKTGSWTIDQNSDGDLEFIYA